MSINHLQMADDMLRDTRDGSGPEMPLMAIGLALVALVRRVDVAIPLLEHIAKSQKSAAKSSA